MKNGRKEVDYKAACAELPVDDELWEKFSTTKITVQWAKISKASKVDLTQFTTFGDPFFVLEVN